MIQQSPTERAGLVARLTDAREVFDSLSIYVSEGSLAALEIEQSQASIDAALSYLASQAAQPAEADGWVMVPREPTEAMLDEACMVDIEIYPTNIPSGLTALNSREARSVWSAFLAATPKAPTSTAECPSSPDGKHQVDTSMESGPNNCFYCGASMEKRNA